MTTETEAISLLLQKKDYADSSLYDSDPTTPYSLVKLKLNEVGTYDLAIKALQKQVAKKGVIRQTNRLVLRPFIIKECPECSKKLKHSFRYCPYCGQKLEWERGD